MPDDLQLPRIEERIRVEAITFMFEHGISDTPEQQMLFRLAMMKGYMLAMTDHHKEWKPKKEGA